MRTAQAKLLDLPEWNVALFAFLLNFVWEMFQAPLYRGHDTSYSDVLFVCTMATAGDAGIAVAAFWLVAWLSRARRKWLLAPSAQRVAGFTAIALLLTIVIEWLSTKVWNRWTYGELMPVIPLLDVGLTPFLQWLVLPPLIIWFANRQIT